MRRRKGDQIIIVRITGAHRRVGIRINDDAGSVGNPPHQVRRIWLADMSPQLGIRKRPLKLAQQPLGSDELKVAPSERSQYVGRCASWRDRTGDDHVGVEDGPHPLAVTTSRLVLRLNSKCGGVALREVIAFPKSLE